MKLEQYGKWIQIGLRKRNTDYKYGEYLGTISIPYADNLSVDDIVKSISSDAVPTFFVFLLNGHVYNKASGRKEIHIVEALERKVTEILKDY